MKTIAVIGAGISVLAAACFLSRRHRVDLFEQERRLGGHTNTVLVDGPNGTVPLDTGFLVHSDRTYPNLVRLFGELGRLVASGKAMPRREFQERYSTEFMTALATIATPRRHANVLRHMLGYFKETLDRESRAELLALIEDHASGRVPLVVPLTLFVHHIRRCDVPYLADQVYMRPHPVELMLRNHV
jgi:uncharacterized protein YbgA (DUF1722 family)